MSQKINAVLNEFTPLFNQSERVDAEIRQTLLQRLYAAMGYSSESGSVPGECARLSLLEHVYFLYKTTAKSEAFMMVLRAVLQELIGITDDEVTQRVEQLQLALNH